MIDISIFSHAPEKKKGEYALAKARRGCSL